MNCEFVKMQIDQVMGGVGQQYIYFPSLWLANVMNFKF